MDEDSLHHAHRARVDSVVEGPDDRAPRGVRDRNYRQAHVAAQRRSRQGMEFAFAAATLAGTRWAHVPP
ncbi:MAG TPA: hypothetical protein VFZ28_12580 [Burkholderiaceae bacterium]|nr:hypothetical protein [Burkholderiaceae bacterium]